MRRPQHHDFASSSTIKRNINGNGYVKSNKENHYEKGYIRCVKCGTTHCCFHSDIEIPRGNASLKNTKFVKKYYGRYGKVINYKKNNNLNDDDDTRL